MKSIKWKKNLVSGVEQEDDNDSNSSVSTVKSVKNLEPQPESELSSRATSVCCTPMHAKNHPNVKIECENGERFYADHIICTIPLGVLKKHHGSLFSPKLPSSKIKAMENLNFGTVFYFSFFCV